MGLTEEDIIYKKSAMPGWLYVDTLNPKNISILKLDDNTNEFIQMKNNSYEESY